MRLTHEQLSDLEEHPFGEEVMRAIDRRNNAGQASHVKPVVKKMVAKKIDLKNGG